MTLRRLAVPTILGLAAVAVIAGCDTGRLTATPTLGHRPAAAVLIAGVKRPVLESLPALVSSQSKSVSPSLAHASDVVSSSAGAALPQGTPPGSAPSAPAVPPAATAMDVMGYWLQPASDHSQVSYAANTPSVSEIAPLWYSVRPDGSVKQWWGSVVPSVVALAHAHGTKVLPLVNLAVSGAPVLNSPPAISQAVANLAAIARANRFDGYNIDFEGIDGNQAQGLVSFMRQLHAALSPMGLETTIDVGPRASSNIPAGDQSAAYDYAALAPDVNQMAIMTYDEHCTGTGPGPVAGQTWVRSIIGYALSVGVPAKKILLGIGDYGYDWAGQNPNAQSVSDPQAEALAAAHGSTISIDPVSGEAHFTYVAAGITHEVWFENAASLGPKLSLATSDHLGGVALWVLGSEDGSIFPTLRADLGTIAP